MRQYEQPDENNPQAPPAQSYSWFDAVSLLIKSPGIATFSLIVKHLKLTPQQAYFYVLVAGIFEGIALASRVSPGEMVNTMIFALPGSIGELATSPDLLTMVLSGSLVGTIYSVISFIIWTFVYHRLGKLIGLNASYRDVAVLRAVFYPLILIVRAIILIIPGAAPMTVNIFLIATMGLDLILSVIATRAAANQLEKLSS